LEIMELEDAASLVEKCMARGVFIQKIPTGKTVTYRLHALFREALSELQPTFLKPEDIKKYQLCAANCYFKRKMFGKAVEHLLQCGDNELVGAVILRESITMDAFEDVNQLHLMFDLLPDSVVSGNVVLLFIKGLIFMHSRYNESLELLQRAFDMTRQSGDFLLQFNIALAMVYAFYSRNNMRGIKRLLGQVDKPEEPYESLFTGAAAGLLDMIRAVFGDRLHEAADIFKVIDSDKLDKNLKWPCHAVACILYYRLGDFAAAINIINEALEMEEIKKSPLLKAQAQMFKAYPLMLKMDFSSLVPIAAEVVEAGEKHDFSYLVGNGKLVQAYMNYAGNDTAGALEDLDYACFHFEQMGNQAMVCFCRLLKYLWGEAGNIEEAAIETLEKLESLEAGYDLGEIGRGIVGGILRNAHDYTGAVQYFRSSIEECEHRGALQAACGAYFQLAALHFETDDRQKGIEALQIALDMAEKHGYRMFWDIHRPTLMKVFKLAVTLSINPEYAAVLIEAHTRGEAVLKDDSNTPWIKISLFGDFKIQVNSDLVPGDVWKTRKIKGILIFLLLNSGKAVSREYLSELFWPDSDRKAASMSFRAALYELKRVMLQYGMVTQEGTPIIHETASGIEITRSGNLVTDLDEFNSLSSRLEANENRSTDNDRKLKLMEGLMRLYRGDLLEYESFDDWMMVDSEKYRSRFIDAALELAGEYMKLADCRKAEETLYKIFSHDSCNEAAALLMVKLYISMGRNSQAVKFFKSFRDRLQRELGVKTDSRLEAAVRDIML
ncbi:MAG: hypothetical protein HGA22_06370, partial [Clostridiales bacterium]|nr:hypothetical protein [Clostridiales bacterium]